MLLDRTLALALSEGYALPLLVAQVLALALGEVVDLFRDRLDFSIGVGGSGLLFLVVVGDDVDVELYTCLRVRLFEVYFCLPVGPLYFCLVPVEAKVLPLCTCAASCRCDLSSVRIGCALVRCVDGVLNEVFAVESLLISL